MSDVLIKEIARLKRENARLKKQEFAHGVAIACSIMQSAHDAPVIISEALNATNLKTRRKLKSLGVDDYDLDILKPVFAELRP